MQAHSPPPDPIDRAPWISKPIAAVLKQALAKRADDRFSSGSQLLAALEAAYEEARAPKAAEDPSVRAVAVSRLELEAGSHRTKASRGPYFALAVGTVALASLSMFRPWEAWLPAPLVPVAVEVGFDAGLPEVQIAEPGAPVALLVPEDAGEPFEVVEPHSEAAVAPDTGRRPGLKGGAKKGKLNIVTTHKGEPYWAQVLIDGISKGRTPLLLELPSGKYLVQVERPGFKTQSREIRVASGKAAVVRIALTQ